MNSHQEEGIFEILFKNAPEGMLVSDKAGRIRHSNPVADRLFGYEEEGLAGNSISDLVPQEKRDGHEELRGGYFEDPSERLMGKGRELEGVRKDGTVFPIEISLNYLHGPDGEMLAISSVIDITERLRYQKRNELFIMEIQEKERQRIARELHDGIAQTLSAISMNLSSLSGKGEAEILDRLNELTQEAIHETRALSHDLMPPDLEEKGLILAIGDILDRVERQGGPRTQLLCPNDMGRYSPKFELALYRICQEAINNSVKHARAASLQVELEERGRKGLFFRIEDDGEGVEAKEMEKSKAGESGMGLNNIQQRVKAFNGDLEIGPGRKKGTSVEGFLPFDMKLHQMETAS